MALVVLPEGTQISGSAGGTTWSHNRYGAYKRNRSVPVNPNTDRQVAVRNAVRALTIAWQTVLTQNQRDGWDAYAANVTWKNALGQDVLLTGLSHYVRSNTQRLTVALPRIDAAPTIFNLAVAEQALSATASEATQDFTIDGDAAGAWLGDPGSSQTFYMGLPQNAAIKFFGGPWRYIHTTMIGPPPFPITAPTAWPFAEGQRLWLRSRIQRSDGRLSEFAQINFLADA